jgi:hypothetical protein
MGVKLASLVPCSLLPSFCVAVLVWFTVFASLLSLYSCQMTAKLAANENPKNKIAMTKAKIR